MSDVIPAGTQHGSHGFAVALVHLAAVGFDKNFRHQEPGLPKINDITSVRVLMFLRNAPRMADVMTDEPGFLTPRIVMQVCTASHTTATPSGLSSSLMMSAIWLVIRSWTCGRRANASTTRAIFEMPTICPLGM